MRLSLKKCDVMDQPTNNTRRCPNCGGVVLPGEKFCANCGIQLPEEESPFAVPPTRNIDESELDQQVAPPQNAVEAGQPAVLPQNAPEVEQQPSFTPTVAPAPQIQYPPVRIDTTPTSLQAQEPQEPAIPYVNPNWQAPVPRRNTGMSPWVMIAIFLVALVLFGCLCVALLGMLGMISAVPMMR